MRILPPTAAASTPWSRREFVRGIGFGMLGMGLPELLQGRALANPLTAKLAARPGKAKHCIMIFLFGGPSQIDTWDMKPAAAAEYRGEFQPIATAVPGISCCEHLPRTARLAKHLAIARSLTMTGRSVGDHHADTYYVLTGHQPDRSFFVEGINRKPHPGDWPCLGSTVASRLPPSPELPGLVQLPARSTDVKHHFGHTGCCHPRELSPDVYWSSLAPSRGISTRRIQTRTFCLRTILRHRSVSTPGREPGYFLGDLLFTRRNSCEDRCVLSARRFLPAAANSA